MRPLLAILGVTSFLLIASAVPSVNADLQAVAQFLTASGQLVGTATFVQQPDGVRITVTVSNLPSGKHGFHIHEQGRCDPPGFTTAGAHFNPERKQHGLKNPNGPHGGDLSNLDVVNGTGTLIFVNPRVTLNPGAPNSLFKVNGTSLVIHANPDDEVTDPTGNSGGRIACGLILANYHTVNDLGQDLAKLRSSLTALENRVKDLESQMTSSLRDKDTQINTLTRQLNQFQLITYGATAFAVVFLITTFYFARKKPKQT